MQTHREESIYKKKKKNPKQTRENVSGDQM